jgi:putative two-component system response regulator
VYDALTTKRVYKEAIPHDESIRMMALEKGSHFDPDMIDALLAIADKFDGIARRYQDPEPMPADHANGNSSA